MNHALNSNRISIIRPPVVVAKWAHTTPTCPPIGLAYIAGTLEDGGWDVSVIDAVGEAAEQFLPTKDERFLSHGLSAREIVERIPGDADAIGISCMFSHEWPVVREIIAEIRNAFPGTLIIAGGEHITALPEFSLKQCQGIDVGITGEGEEAFADVLQAIKQKSDLADVTGIIFREQNGDITQTEHRKRIRELDEISAPAWHLFPLEIYLKNGYGFGVNRGRSMPVLATRGCPYQCTFCSNPAMWGTRWIARDVDLFFDEMMEYLDRYQIDNFDFYDLTAIVKKKWIVTFCNKIMDSGRTFTWQLPSGTRSEAIDAEVAQLLYDSGCRNMSYAPESGAPSVLTRIKKKIDLDKMKVSMRDSVRAGINCKANIIIGFPGETHKEVRQTMRFIVQMAFLGIHDVSVSPFSPYPGSELYDGMYEEGRIPELTDEYFFSLASYTDLTSTISCSENISDRALGFYRLFGMLLFYAALYATRPWRLFTTIKNVFGEQQESRLEMSLKDLVVRLTKSDKKNA